MVALTQVQLDALYKKHGQYASQLAQQAEALVAEGFCVAADAEEAVAGAAHEDVPGGTIPRWS